MANTIVLKRSATPGKVPTTSQLALGEIAINTNDGLIYIKKDNGVTTSVVQIGGVTSVNGETGSVTIDTNDVAENGNLYFTDARARAAISAGSGISYNSSTGAISTAQTLTTAGSPTFVNLTLTGGIPSISGSIIPSADITYDLGSPTKQWKDVYVGPGSLYVNGQKVLQDDSGTITFSADIDENIRIKTLGTGVLQLGSSTTNINIDGTLQIAAGKNITDSAGIKVNFGDNIEMNGNKVIGLGTPSTSTDAATKGYVDSSISAISTSAISQGNTNITVVDTGTGQVQVNVDGTTALTVDSTGVTVAGNFTVSGTTTTINANTINLADNIITLNSDATGAPTQNAGLEVKRGDEASTQIRWNEGTQQWTFTNNGAVYYPIAVGTDALAEGTTNLYHTAARARSALSVTSNTGISYSSSTGVFNLASIPNSSLTNSSVTIGSTSTALGATSTTLAGLTSVTSTGFTGALTGNADTATALATGRTIAITGDITYTSPTFNGSGNVTAAATLATVNSNVGAFGSATAIPVVTVNAKGLITAISTTAVSIPSGALTFTGDVTGTGTTGSSTALTIKTSPTLTTPTLSGTTTVGGHMIPNTDLAYDLGSATFRYRNLYLSGSTIAITGSTSGTLTIAAPAVAGTTTVTFPATTGTVITTGDTGTVTNTMLAGSIADTKLATISTAGKVSNSATTAASANTASAIVARDASGNFTAGTITANLTGNTTGTHTGAVVGNTDTATSAGKWTTARTITLGGDLSGSVSIDGSANVTLTATVSADATTLGTDTTGNYVASITNGSYLTGANGGSEGAALTLAVDATDLNTASKVVARDASGNFAAGTITAALTGNVTGNVTGTSGSTTGNAATVTNGVYTTDTGTVTNTMLAGSIANAKLTNSSTTIGTTAIALGATSTTLAGLTSVTSTTFVGALTGNASTATSATTAGTITSQANSATIAAASANTASTIVLRDASGNFTAGTITAALTGNTAGTHTGAVVGNASTATTLATARAIQGVNFDGSAAITVVTAGTGISVSGTAVTNTLSTSGGSIGGAIAVTGAITATGEVTAYFSDLRLKTNIVPIEDALEKVEAINGVTFDPNDAALALGIDDRHQMGVIAQEVEAVAPELVCDSAFAGYKTVRYDKLTALLIEAVKELSAKVKTLEAQLGNTKPQL